MPTKTQTPTDIPQGDNAPDMGTLGANAITGETVSPATGKLGVADPGSFNAVQPGTQADINEILSPYINELLNLGPEYGQEMEYLKPYLMGQGANAPQTFQGVVDASKAAESPTGDTRLQEAEQQVGQAAANETMPGFGGMAEAAKEFEGTVPYAQLLQTLLGAGKNEILYGTTPNISNVNTSGWPATLQQAYSFLTQAATGTNAQSGLQAPKVAAKKGAQASGTGSGGTGGSTTQGGGNG